VENYWESIFLSKPQPFREKDDKAVLESKKAGGFIMKRGQGGRDLRKVEKGFGEGDWKLFTG